MRKRATRKAERGCHCHKLIVLVLAISYLSSPLEYGFE